MAGFGPMFKTKITNASNTIVIVLLYYGLIKGWHGGRFEAIVDSNVTNTGNITVILFFSYKWWHGGPLTFIYAITYSNVD